MNRPITRGECLSLFYRPCPFISCQHHLLWALKGSERKRIMASSDDEVAEAIFNFKETCVLDVADEDGLTYEEIGEILMCSKARAQAIVEGNKKQCTGLKKIKESWRKEELAKFWR